MPQTIPTQPVLIVEDDPNTAALIETYLQREGFSTVLAYDGATALQLAHAHDPCLLILDIMLPEVDGWEICRQLRRDSQVPILMLSAREEEIDRVLGLSLGADDYVVKPFSPRELVERVKAILRRSAPSRQEIEELLRHGDLCLDPKRHKVTVAGESVELTATEYRLLYALMNSPGRLFSREELLSRLYQHGEIVVDRVIDVHIGKLRQKIESGPGATKHILTVRGFGYQLTEDDES